MRAFGEVEIYDGKKIPFGFTHSDGVTKLILGDDGICFQMRVPDYDAQSSIARIDLPKELAIAATAKAIFEQAHLAGHLKRDGSANEPPPFPDIPAAVHIEEPIRELGPQRMHAVWARRFVV